MNLIEIVDLIAVQIEDIGHMRVPLRLLIHQINAVQSYIANLIMNQEEDLFTASETIVPISAGTILPKDFARVRDISVNGIPVEIIQPAQRHIFSDSLTEWPVMMSGAFYAFLRGNKVYFYSGMEGGSDVNFIYTRRLPKLHRGKPQAATSTTVTLAAEALIGAVETSDSYYTNATIIALSGPGAGEEHVISEYVGSTKIATTDEWIETPTIDTVYEIKCELPENPDFQIILCDIVSDKMGKGKNNPQVWQDIDMKLGQLSGRNSQNAWITV